MTKLLVDHATSSDQTAFNLERWAALCTDPQLATLRARFETDRFGRTIMSPPATRQHGKFQSLIAQLLTQHEPKKGTSYVEAPGSTPDGVKAADVG